MHIAQKCECKERNKKHRCENREGVVQTVTHEEFAIKSEEGTVPSYSVTVLEIVNRNATYITV